MPQLTQSEPFTTASRSNGLPSVRRSIEIALNGQSSAQRAHPLQLSRSTRATAGRRNGGSHGMAAIVSVSTAAVAHTVPCDQRSSRG